MCGETMTFPDTVEEFMERYKMVDREQVYSNGAEYVPIFRMKQWFEHADLISRQAVKDWLLKWEGYIDKDTITRMQYRVIDIHPIADKE